MDVIAIATLFNPDDSCVVNMMEIAKQSTWLYIYDNSYCDHKYKFIDMDNIKYYHSGNNLGLSKAFNFILNEITDQSEDDKYIIFFDQDTRIHPSHINRLCDEYARLIECNENVGILAPIYIEEENSVKQIPKKYQILNSNSIRVKQVITSSMLTKLSVLKSLGGWNGDIFLDMADWDLCWRARYHGYTCVLTNASYINHKVGKNMKKTIFGWMNIWEPYRSYYQLREIIKNLFLNYVPYNERIVIFFRCIINNILSVIMEKNKIKRIKYMLHGIVDAIQGYNGPIRMK